MSPNQNFSSIINTGIIIEQVIITSVTSAVDDKRSDSSTNIAEDQTGCAEPVIEGGEEVDKMSGVTSASSCCRCNNNN